MIEGKSSRTLLVVAATLVLVGAVLRVFASLTDFWIDEILTLDWPRNYSYWELIAGAATKHDNNHVLNSLWLKGVESFGEPGHWLPYRMLSIVTGTIAAAAMGSIGWRRSPVEGVIAAGLGSLSFVLVHYSSECRGYAPVCCFALISWIVVERGIRAPGWRSAVGLGACAVLGVWSHSTYAFAYLGLGVWSVVAWRNGTRLGTLVRLHAFPVVFLGLIYFTRIRGMVIGGGPEFGVPRALTNTLAHVIGWAWTGDWQGYVAAWVTVALVVTAGVLRYVKREPGDSSWAFYATLVVVTPLLVAFVLKPRIVFMRYFLVCVPFLMLLVAGLAAHGWRCCRAGRIASIVLLVAVAGMNVWRLEGLLTAGRGQYLDALRFIEANDPSPEIRVCGNEQLHIARIIGFYQKFLRKRIVFVQREDARRPGWIIYESQRFLPESLALAEFGAVYDQKAEFGYASMSGAHWYLLRRDR